MPLPLLDTSPLYENEDFEEGSILTVSPIEQLRDERNCVEVTNRGADAFECAGELTQNRRQTHSSILVNYGMGVALTSLIESRRSHLCRQ